MNGYSERHCWKHVLWLGYRVYSFKHGICIGAISGGGFNPAVAVGISIMGLTPWHDFWVYFVGCFGGAALAAIVFRINNPEDR